MVTLQELVRYTNNLLSIDELQDYCPNGLQVEGRTEVNCLISGVTASQALLEAAVSFQADAILVHHGYFWKGEDPRIVGMKQRRIGYLLSNQISLLAYHLPLDAHAELGNNAQLARRLGFDFEGRFRVSGGPDIGMYGALKIPMSGAELASHIGTQLGRVPLHIAGGPQTIRSIGWCTGAAQSYLEAAADLQLDAFVSGEVSEPTVHVARERGIHYFAAGHHATERYGAGALGHHLADHFSLDHQFVDIDNPV